MSNKWLGHWGIHPSSGPITESQKKTSFAQDSWISYWLQLVLPHISSSTVWISVKFGITGKLFSRRIQCRMLRRTRITPYGKRWQLLTLCHSDHSGDIWSISNPDFSYLDVSPPAQDVLLQFGTDLGEI